MRSNRVRYTTYIALVVTCVLACVLTVLEGVIISRLSGASVWEAQAGVCFATLVIVITTVVTVVKSYWLPQRPQQAPSNP